MTQNTLSGFIVPNLFRFAVANRLTESFRDLSDTSLENMLQTGIAGLRERQAHFDQQRLKLLEATQQLEAFVRAPAMAFQS